MKVEAGTFSANSSSVTALLNDDTLNIKGILFQISPDTTVTSEASTGFSDGMTNRSKSLLVTSTKRESHRSTTYSVLHYKDISGTSTRKIAGKLATGGLTTAGEFTMDFTNYDASIPIDFMVYGD